MCGLSFGETTSRIKEQNIIFSSSGLILPSTNQCPIVELDVNGITHCIFFGISSIYPPLYLWESSMLCVTSFQPYVFTSCSGTWVQVAKRLTILNWAYDSFLCVAASLWRNCCHSSIPTLCWKWEPVFLTSLLPFFESLAEKKDQPRLLAMAVTDAFSTANSCPQQTWAEIFSS